MFDHGKRTKILITPLRLVSCTNSNEIAVVHRTQMRLLLCTELKCIVTVLKLTFDGAVTSAIAFPLAVIAALTVNAGICDIMYVSIN